MNGAGNEPARKPGEQRAVGAGATAADGFRISCFPRKIRGASAG
jgi:hypothetical protein